MFAGAHGKRDVTIRVEDTMMALLNGRDAESGQVQQNSSEFAIKKQNESQNGVTHLFKAGSRLKCNEKLNKFNVKIATLNVASFSGKETQLINTMKKRNLFILGLCETKLASKYADSLPDGYKLVYHIGHTVKHGVAFLLSPAAAKMLRRVFYKGDDIICIDVNLGHAELSIMQVYAPHINRPHPDKRSFYKALQDVYNSRKYKDNIIVMGDFNGYVGTERKGMRSIIGPFSVGHKNESGKLTIEFCASNSLSVMNTFFMHDDKHKWTSYRRNEGTSKQTEKHMTDLMLSSSKYLFKDVKAIPYLSYKSEHRLVVAKLNVQKPYQIAEAKKIFKLESLENEECLKLLRDKVSIRMPRGNLERGIEEEWNFMKDKLDALAKKALTEKEIYRTRRKNSSWWSDDIRKSKKEVWNTIGKDFHDITLGTKMLLYSMSNYEKGSSPPWFMASDENDTENKDIIPRRWELYFETLTNIKEDILHDDEDRDDIICETEITLDETVRAIKSMRNGLAPGDDSLPAEIFKNAGTSGAKWLRYVCNIAWKQEKIPYDWGKAIIGPVYKKMENTEGGHYMGMSVLSHAGKVYERILEHRLRSKVEKKLGEWQHGFQSNRRALDLIFSMRIILEKSLEWRQSRYLAFIAFDDIPREQYWKALYHKEYGVDPKLVRVIQNMYKHWDNRNLKAEEIDMPVGVCPSGLLSPLLCIIYMDWCLKELPLDEDVTAFVHAADMAIMANTKEQLQKVIDRWCTIMARKGVAVSKTMSTVMHVGKEREDCDIYMGGDRLRQVDQMTFLGVVFNQENSHQAEVDNRIEKYTANVKVLSPLLADKMISQQCKVKIYTSFLRPILTYGSEAWSVTKVIESQITGAEMSVLRAIYCVTRLNIPSDIEVRRELEVTPISNIIEKRKLLWYGQIQRMPDTRFPKKFLKWTPKEKRPRDGSQARWILGVKKALEARRTTLEDVEKKRSYQNLKEWGELVHRGRERNRTRNQRKQC